MADKKFITTIKNITVHGIQEEIYIPNFESGKIADLAIWEIEKNNKFKNESAHVLDLCTGTGLIALLIAKNANAHITGVDINPLAIKFANQNISKNNLDPFLFKFIEGDLFETILEDEKFDFITGFVPCFTEEQYDQLYKHPTSSELPRNAFISYKGKHYFYSQIAKESKNFLKPYGKIILGVPFDQEEIKDIFNKYNFTDIQYVENKFLIATYLGEEH